MRSIAVASAKASPGVTTLATAIATTWPEDEGVILVEADPSGGDLAVRFGLDAKPGLVTLATAARRSNDSGLIWQHTQMLTGDLPVVVSSTAGDQARVALDLLGSDFFVRADSPDGAMTAIIDLGRLDTTAPSWSIAQTCDLVVLCCRPVLAEIHHLVATTSLLDQHNINVALVLIGNGPYTATDVEGVTKTNVIAHVPFDQHGAAALSGLSTSRRMLNRSRLLRATRDLSERLASRIQSNTNATTTNTEEIAS